MADGMMTIKEYAESRGKSVQAVYKQIKSKENAKELEGHIVVQKVGNKNTKLLDEMAVEVLDNASKQSPQVILQTDDKERIEQLENENKLLWSKVAELQDELLKEKDQVKALQLEKIELLEMKNAEPETKWWQFWK